MTHWLKKLWHRFRGPATVTSKESEDTSLKEITAAKMEEWGESILMSQFRSFHRPLSDSRESDYGYTADQQWRVIYHSMPLFVFEELRRMAPTLLLNGPEAIPPVRSWLMHHHRSPIDTEAVLWLFVLILHENLEDRIRRELRDATTRLVVHGITSETAIQAERNRGRTVPPAASGGSSAAHIASLEQLTAMFRSESITPAAAPAQPPCDKLPQPDPAKKLLRRMITLDKKDSPDSGRSPA